MINKLKILVSGPVSTGENILVSGPVSTGENSVAKRVELAETSSMSGESFTTENTSTSTHPAPVYNASLDGQPNRPPENVDAMEVLEGDEPSITNVGEMDKNEKQTNNKNYKNNENIKKQKDVQREQNLEIRKDEHEFHKIASDTEDENLRNNMMEIRKGEHELLKITSEIEDDNLRNKMMEGIKKLMDSFENFSKKASTPPTSAPKVGTPGPKSKAPAMAPIDPVNPSPKVLTTGPESPLNVIPTSPKPNTDKEIATETGEWKSRIKQNKVINTEETLIKSMNNYNIQKSYITYDYMNGPMLKIRSGLSNLACFPTSVDVEKQKIFGKTENNEEFKLMADGFFFANKNNKPVYCFKYIVGSNGWKYGVSAIPLIKAVGQQVSVKGALRLTGTLAKTLGEKFQLKDINEDEKVQGKDINEPPRVTSKTSTSAWNKPKLSDPNPNPNPHSNSGLEQMHEMIKLMQAQMQQQSQALLTLTNVVNSKFTTEMDTL